jgi:glycosyltransferase involved in cell wall biosynthesis
MIKSIPEEIAEIIIVDNGSSDNTFETAKKIALTEKRVVAVQDNRTKNGIGYGFAHMTGIVTASSEFIAGADADGTYPVELLPKIAEMMDKNNLDFVSCNRYPIKDGTEIPLKLRVGVGLLNLEIGILYGLKIQDTLSGMWIFRRNIMDELKLTEGDWNLSPQIKLNAARNPKIRFTEFNISQNKRMGETKQNYFKTGFGHAIWILKNRFNNEK